MESLLRRKRKQVFPTPLRGGTLACMEPESKWKSRAIAIEFWLAALLVGGSFVAGLIAAIRAFLS